MPTPKKKKTTSADAELILKLYELRREPEMRKARDTEFSQFWPDTVEDLLNVTRAYGTDMNRYLRQVIGYWDMACALVLHGALDEDLFFECSHEMYPLFAKIHPFITGFREATGTPDAFANLENLIMNNERSRERLARVEARLPASRNSRPSARRARPPRRDYCHAVIDLNTFGCHPSRAARGFCTRITPSGRRLERSKYAGFRGC